LVVTFLLALDAQQTALDTVQYPASLKHQKENFPFDCLAASVYNQTVVSMP
jgi:hypothetical protein